MTDDERYKVWGYWAKNGRDTHHNRKWIGKAKTLEEARQLKQDAENLGWPTVCIFEDGKIVEPAMWAGRQHPCEP